MSQAISSQELTSRRCRACAPGTPPLTGNRLAAVASAVPEWTIREGKELSRTFRFANFHETMALVNAVAWIAHREDHHPDMLVGYNTLTITYSTHSVGGLSENDLICAAKVDALMR